MKKLPIGIQNFAELRKGDYLYVDKTRYVHDLATSGKYFFLSRPRRFGKSLLISTLRELFLCNRPLFQRLWIEDHWNWEQPHPVLHIPFSSLGYKDLGLERALHEHLDDLIAEHELDVQEESLALKFRELLRRLHEAEGNRVVVLIDEYDKPIIDYLGEEIALAKANQKVLKNFYSILKDSDPHLRLVFITGVSKFSRVSIFSDLNNLNDITLNPRCATMLGYTQQELEACFEEHIQHLCRELEMSRKSLLDEIALWYNGYSWDGKSFVYNPFSILLLFNHLRFSNFWFSTATPTFLINLLREHEFYDLDGIQVSDLVFESFDLDNLELTSLLFQTGYLTVRQYDRQRRLYTLGYPNLEVKESMLGHLIDAFSDMPRTRVRHYVFEVIDGLQQGEVERVVEVLNTLLHSVPHQLHDKSERFYHVLIHLFFTYIGLEVHSEVNTARGRADAIVELEDKVYCFEFKMNDSAQKALEQILERGYLEKYHPKGKRCIAIGINFSTEKRCIDGMELQEV